MTIFADDDGLREIQLTFHGTAAANKKENENTKDEISK
jgi:hypothetical protein